MSEAKRYIFDSLLGMMVENADGEYRRNSDYEALERENAELTARITSLEREKEEDGRMHCETNALWNSAKDRVRELEREKEEARDKALTDAARMIDDYEGDDTCSTCDAVLARLVRAMKGAKP